MEKRKRETLFVQNYLKNKKKKQGIILLFLFYSEQKMEKIEFEKKPKIQLFGKPTFHNSKEFNDHFKNFTTTFKDEYFVDNFMRKLTTDDLICLNPNQKLNALLLDFYFYFKFQLLDHVQIYHSGYFIPIKSGISKIEKLHENGHLKPNANIFIIPLLFRNH
jgi:hypothetical protein